MRYKYNPGSDMLSRYPDWVVRHRDLYGIPEVLCARRKVILIERDMPVAERRCALAHAIAHIDLGHSLQFDCALEAREEAAADRLAARRLIDLRDLAPLLLADLPPEAVAHELEVTPEFLALRYRALHPSERGWLNQRLTARENVA